MNSLCWRWLERLALLVLAVPFVVYASAFRVGRFPLAWTVVALVAVMLFQLAVHFESHIRQQVQENLRKVSNRERRLYLPPIAKITGPTIHSAPGWGLLRVGCWVCSASTFDRVLAPVISDMQIEVTKSLAEGRLWRARWHRSCGCVFFWTHLLALAPVSLVRMFAALWRFFV
jgi:hypothetical protein